MPSYNCGVYPGEKGGGSAHLSYILRRGKFASRLELAMPSGKQTYADLLKSGFGNLPSWAKSDPILFFKESDRRERKNGTSHRKMHIALPRCDVSIQVNIVEELCQILFHGDGMHAYAWAIHNPVGTFDEEDQPHSHIVYCEREIDSRELDPSRYFSKFVGIDSLRGGYGKATNTKAERWRRLMLLRSSAADVINAHLEAGGIAERVSHESFRALGKNVEPERPYFGKARLMKSEIILSRQLKKSLVELTEELANERVSLGQSMIIHELVTKRRLRFGTAGDVFLNQTRAETAAGLSGGVLPGALLTEEHKKRVLEQFGMFMTSKPQPPVDGGDVDVDVERDGDEDEDGHGY